MSELLIKGKAAKQAARKLSQLSTAEKNRALTTMADSLLINMDYILEENKKDMEFGRNNETTEAILDRLSLNAERIGAMAEGLTQVAALNDPIGELMENSTRPNDLRIEKVRVPLGVVGIIYEARPNVTVDAAGLCLKTGNAAFLRGSSSALHSNKAIIHVIQAAHRQCGIPVEALQLLEDTSRETSDRMLRLNEYLDVLIPRGGAGLISHVVQHASVPVLETGVGNCHIFIDQTADPNEAIQIVLNAKTQRPAVCNAVETVLVHPDWARKHMEEFVSALKHKKVEIRACEKTRQFQAGLLQANERDWETEYLDFILAIKTVDNIEDAISHIDQYGTGHSECIITKDSEHARKFLSEVDAAAVYHNASTRFTDGFEFGFGAEIGISTQKLHARGPMGLVALTSYKYLIHGDGQIRE